MGLLAVVPFLDAFVIWAPTAAFLALTGDYLSAVILVAWGTVDNVVYPILVGSRLKMHTVPSFIAIWADLCCSARMALCSDPLRWARRKPFLRYGGSAWWWIERGDASLNCSTHTVSKLMPIPQAFTIARQDLIRAVAICRGKGDCLTPARTRYFARWKPSFLSPVTCPGFLSSTKV